VRGERPPDAAADPVERASVGDISPTRPARVNENPEHQHLRVLIANQRSDRLDHVTSVVVSLGHEVVARSIEVDDVATVTGREHPDVALVGLGDSSQHALDLIGEIVRQAACPVIALLETDDHAFVNQAAKRGVFAYITDTNPQQLQDSIEIVLRRFAEFQNLEGAFGRRALIERAKGILMERHSATEEQAFEMLRTHARSGNRKLIDIAAAVVDGHRLLPGPPKVSGVTPPAV
jgi:AmiR/NasT family two-component response regulator